MKPYPRLKVLLSYLFSASVVGFMVGVIYAIHDLYVSEPTLKEIGLRLSAAWEMALFCAWMSQIVFTLPTLLLGLVACAFKMQKTVRHYLILSFLGGFLTILNFEIVNFTPSGSILVYMVAGALTAFITGRLCLPRNGVCSAYDPY